MDKVVHLKKTMVVAYYGSKRLNPTERAWHFFGYMDGHYGFFTDVTSPFVLRTSDPGELLRAYRYAIREQDHGRIDGSPLIFYIEVRMTGPVDTQTIVEKGYDEIRKKALAKLDLIERQTLGLE